MDQTPRLALPHIIGGQALKHITHNEALMRLDALVQASVEARSLDTPPSAPLEGEAWIIPPDANGAWAGHETELVVWQAGAWRFYDPAAGWLVFDRATGALCVFSGGHWIALAATGAGLPFLGVNIEADDETRLAVAAHASLLGHDGEGHRLQIDKANSAETASVMFQKDGSGRAEMGLIEDDSWRLMMSADGVSWTEALVADGTGVVKVAEGLYPLADNAVSLGASGARWSAVWAATGLIETSDQRQKTDIAPTDLGLDFILSLKPVRYRWRDGGEDQKVHYGLLAQDVLAATKAAGVEGFGGHILVDETDAESRQALRYSSFIAPLISAVQGLAQRVAALEAQ